MSMEDYEHLTSSMAQVLSLNSELKILKLNLENEEDKLAVESSKYESLKNGLQKLNVRMDREEKFDVEYNKNGIDSCNEKIEFYKSKNNEYSKILRKRPRVIVNDTAPTAEEYVIVATVCTVLIIVIAVLLSYGNLLAHLVPVPEDGWECREDATDNDGFTWDSMEECNHQKIVVIGSTLFGIPLVLALTYVIPILRRRPGIIHRKQLAQAHEFDVENRPVQEKFEASKSKIGVWEQYLRNAKALEEKSRLFTEQEKRMIESEIIVKSTKARIISAKANIRSNLNSVSHLVPYNENLPIQ